MSQPSTGSEIAAEYRADILDTYLVTSMTALAVWEYVITFKHEVKMVWRRRWRLTTWMFIANRYVMIASAVWNFVPTTAQSCTPVMLFNGILAMIQYCIFALFSAIRVFAICNRNISMAIVVLVLSLVPVAINTYGYFRQTYIFAVDPVFGVICCAQSNLSVEVNLYLTLSSRVALIGADILVLVLTLHKTFKIRMQGTQTPLSSMLLRDGTTYFSVLLAMNLAQIIVNAVPSLEVLSPVGIIIQVLEPVLITRFLLNLRQLGETDRCDDTQDASHLRLSSHMFRLTTLAIIVGNMGEDLDHSLSEEEEEERDGNNVIFMEAAASEPHIPGDICDTVSDNI